MITNDDWSPARAATCFSSIYAAATVAFGPRFNLTNRRYRHAWPVPVRPPPGVPLQVARGGSKASRPSPSRRRSSSASSALWYGLRAWTEERHLSADPTTSRTSARSRGSSSQASTDLALRTATRAVARGVGRAFVATALVRWDMAQHGEALGDFGADLYAVHAGVLPADARAPARTDRARLIVTPSRRRPPLLRGLTRVGATLDAEERRKLWVKIMSE